LIALPHALTVANAQVIINLAQRYRMPTVYAFAENVAAGGLVSYGINWNDHFRSVADYVDRILKGAKPSDLAVQNPTRFKLAVNLRAAKAIGLTIPETFLLRADEVIE
jgi:putative ABC transport system substrate-binding protein